MIFSENRFPLFGIMLGVPCPPKGSAGPRRQVDRTAGSGYNRPMRHERVNAVVRALREE